MLNTRPLKGFPDAINTVYPQARIQLCIVHMVRNSLRFVAWKDYKAVTRDLKAVYQAPTEEAAPSGAGEVRWEMGSPLSADKPELAVKLGQPVDILLVPAGTSQGNLHDERYRITEQRAPACNQETQGVPD